MSSTPVENLNCSYFLNYYLNPNVHLVISILLLVVITIFVFKYYKNKLTLFGLFMICLGGLQNISQRVRYNCVVDDYKFFNLFSFNLADLFIMSGLLIILVYIYSYGKKNPTSRRRN